MAKTTNEIKHVGSPLARQTLLDSELTRPVADKRPARRLDHSHGCARGRNVKMMRMPGRLI
jgi:hypothetical protein